MNKQLSFDPDILTTKYNLQKGKDGVYGYGSGLFTQEGNVSKKNMIDLIFPVENTHEWHKANLENNANDYSKYARKHGLEIIDALQETCAKIYYHPYVPFEGQTIKYGVISVDDMIRDLNERSHLYVAGRAHKPMATILENEKIDEAMRNNRNSAVNTALLFLPEEFSKMDLYMKIANLSYMGDSRKMLRGEPKDKVGRIVKGSREGFENIYAPIINSKKDILQALNGDKIQQTFEPRETANLYYSLPSHLREVAGEVTRFNDRTIMQEQIKKAITSIVKDASVGQSLKGYRSAGLGRSTRYLLDKAKKARFQ